MNEVKNKEVLTYKESIDLKQTWVYLAIFSFVGVFLPLFMLTTDPIIMDRYKLHTFIIVSISWVILLFHFIREISNLSCKGGKND